MESSVLLPAPFGPAMPSTSPGRTSRVKSSTAVTAGRSGGRYVLQTLWKLITADLRHGERAGFPAGTSQADVSSRQRDAVRRSWPCAGAVTRVCDTGDGARAHGDGR